MKCKWLAKVDFQAAKKWCLLLLLYFGVLLTSKNYYYVSSVSNGIGTNLYLYLQFIPSIVIVPMIGDVFEETFRENSKMYLRSFGISVYTIILRRLFRFSICIILFYMPLTIFSTNKMNFSMRTFCETFPNEMKLPSARFTVLLFHCCVTMIFVAVLTVFILFLFSNKALAVMLLFTLFAFDILVARYYLFPFNIFRGSFDCPDLYHYFPPNIIMECSLCIVFTTIICLGYNRK